jgi:hypothetical protein
MGVERLQPPTATKELSMKTPHPARRDLDFHAAFLDFDTQRIFPSRFADGRPAPLHLLDGLPDELVIDRAPSGRVIAAKASVIPGFVRDGYFYTRSAMARAAAEWPQVAA